VAKEAAVLGDALGDEWVGELQQQRASPAEEENPLGVDLPADRVSRLRVGTRGQAPLPSAARIVARWPNGSAERRRRDWTSRSPSWKMSMPV
jgi:hypothetical protein